MIFRDLAETLSQHIDVTVLTSGCRGLASREKTGALEIVRAFVPLRTSKSVAGLTSMLSFFPSSIFAGRRLLESKSYDLVHTSFAVPSGPSGLLLARRFGIPHILSIHGGDIYDPTKFLSPHRTPILRHTVKWVIHGSDRVVAQSKDTAERAKIFYGNRMLDRVPLAAKPGKYRSVPRSDLGLRQDDLVLVTVGRLVPRKGLAQLIDIVATLADQRFRLIVVGDGPQRTKLEQHAQEVGAQERVLFTGHVAEERKWQILHNSDLYVSTTLHEGFGIVFLEAMLSGLPVLSYDHGGQVDFLTNEFGGLVPVGDVEEFRNLIVEICGNPQLRARMGHAARSEARKYHVDRFAGRYMDIYEECLRN